MADNDANFTDEETYEVIDDNYQGMAANDDDENDEGTIEYLDLELENETLEEYCQEKILPITTVPPNTTKSVVYGSSVLKTSYESVESKIAPKYRPIRIKPAITVPERSIMRTRSSTENSANRSAVKRTVDCLASANVHTAVNNINARLADSVKAVNGRTTKKSLSNNGNATMETTHSSVKDSSNVESKSEMDSLDLFFQSMAQTVLNLPSQVQAQIKMDIYKVIATAEIKYSSPGTVQGVGKI